MPPRPPSAHALRFDVFEVDLRAEELYKAGHKVKLQVQPFHVLAMMLERPGEVVTREELQKRLWPADTFVDFDHSLNTAIKKLRQALDDDKNKPRFIETLPKRGYRFLGVVEGPVPSASRVESTPRAIEPPATDSSSWVGRVVKITCEDGLSFVLVAIDEGAAAERRKLDAAQDDVGLSLLIASQRLLMLAHGTPVRVLEVQQSHSRCEARILEGEHYGKTALVPMHLLVESPEFDFSRGPRQWSLGG